MAFLVLIFSAISFTNTQAKANKIKSGFYTIYSAVGNNKVLDVCNASENDEANIQLWENNETLAQIFYINYTDDGYYEITSACSQKALDIQYANAYMGANVWQYALNGTDAQKWRFENLGNNTVKIKSKLGNYVLDVCQRSSENGANIQIWEDNGTDAQKFKLSPIDINKFGLLKSNYSYTAHLGKLKNYLMDYFNSLSTKNILILSDENLAKHLENILNNQIGLHFDVKTSLNDVNSQKYDLVLTQKYNPKYLKVIFKNQKIELFKIAYATALYQATIDYLNQNNIPIYFFDAPKKEKIKKLNEIDRKAFYEYAPTEWEFKNNKWFVERAFGQNKECIDYILSGDVFNYKIIKIKNHFALADSKSKYCNIVDHHRLVPNAPSNYKNTVYLYGPCTMRSKYVTDNYTIEKTMQERINRDFPNSYNVVGYGVEANELNDFEYILDTKFKPGDIVIEERNFSKTLSKIISKNYCYRGSLSKAMNSYKVGNFALEDISHLNHNGCKAAGNYMYDCIKRKIKQLSGQKLENKIIQFEEDQEENSFINENPDFVPYLNNLKNLAEPYKKENKKIGSLNVNCNPFTRGHRYLIEEALKRVDHLFLFVVEEDASEFSFKDRYEMVKRGIADLDNITLLTTGKWMCSKFTFPDYFNKDSLQDKVILNPTKDIELYGRYIAPAIGATVRFAGEEPLDLITRQHNNFMKNKLPEYGIEFCEIPRKTLDNGQVISASKVRKYLKEKNLEELKKLVPKTTYDYLIEHFT